MLVRARASSLMAPMLSDNLSGSRRLYWELPSETLARAFVEMAAVEAPELVVGLHQLDVNEWVVTTTYAPDQLSATFFVIHLVAKLHARQVQLKALYFQEAASHAD